MSLPQCSHLSSSLSPCLHISVSPCLPISLSPCLPISLSPYLPVSLSPHRPISPSPLLPIYPSATPSGCPDCHRRCRSTLESICGRDRFDQHVSANDRAAS